MLVEPDCRTPLAVDVQPFVLSFVDNGVVPTVATIATNNSPETDGVPDVTLGLVLVPVADAVTAVSRGDVASAPVA